MSRSFQYLVFLLVAVIALFSGAWALAAKGKIGFLPTQYVIYKVKKDMLANCNVGDVMVVGDSRPMAGIIPAEMPALTRNLALGAASSIEGYYAIDRALACPKPPKMVVLSLSLRDFRGADNLWRFSAAYGYLNQANLYEVRQVASQVGDEAIFASQRGDGVPDSARIWLYGHDFPSFYTGSMLEAALVGRRAKNLAAEQKLIASEGQFYYGQEAFSHQLNDDTVVTEFKASPLVEAYLDRIVQRLQAANVPLVFTAVPMNDASFAALNPQVQEDFRRYVASYAARTPSFHVLGDVIPHWPDDLFGDEQHLNPRGARRFTAEFGSRLIEAGFLPPTTYEGSARAQGLTP